MTIPGWVAALLRLLAPDGQAEDVVGDLNEIHARRVARHGRGVAAVLTAFATLDMAFALFRGRLPFGNFDTTRLPRGRRRSVRPGAIHERSGRWDMRGAVDNWIRDFRQTGRSLVKARGYTVVTVLTLALAIGVNTAIFSIVDAVLLDPLGLPAADRLVSIRASAPGFDLPETFGPGAEFYVQYREQADLLEDIAIWDDGQTTVRSDDRIDRLFVSSATPSLFSTLGVQPQLGRLPTADDESGTVMVISDWLWRDWFGADPEVVGRSYEVSGERRTVVGVMGPEFRYPYARISLWVHRMVREADQIEPGDLGLDIVARMRPGVTPDDLEGQLDVAASRLPERFGGSARYAELIAQHRSVVTYLEDEMVGSVARPLWLLLGTVGIVLLIACANVANLFMVRAEGRRLDLGIRKALGAGRGGLVRIQMAEALLLAGMGGALGAFLAWAGIPLLVRAAPEASHVSVYTSGIPNLDLVRLDATALAFTLGVSALTAVLFGLMPALQASKLHFVGGMRQSGGVGGSGRRWGRDALVLLQTASALVLLVGSGLLLRSFWTLSHVDPGFDTEDIFSFQVAPQRPELNDGPSFAQFHTTFMQSVAGLPGVESVGLTGVLPLDEGAGTNRFRTEAHVRSGERPPPMRMTLVGGDYFGVMGIELLRGRLLEPTDHVVGANNIVVGESAAAQLWPGEDPLGKGLLHAPNSTAWLRVVGVVEDIYVEDFRQDEPDPMVYLPMVGPEAGSWGVGSPAYVVKTPRAAEIASDVRELMRAEVPESPMYRVFTMEALARRSMAQLSFTMLMLAIASGLALVLGAVGVYGVLSYVVTNRSKEMAVRMALGAEGRGVRRMVVFQGARMALLGVIVGVAAAVGLTRVLESLLFGVEALDAPTFVGMSGVMVLVALLASYLPARRASMVDPMQVLRTE